MPETPDPCTVSRVQRTVLLLLALLLPMQAQALTLSNLKDQGLDKTFGRYAPHGNCSAGPVITIDATGFTFNVGGKKTHPTHFEYAVSYMGPEYSGIGSVFFPFVRSDSDFGPTQLTVNADEISGKLVVEVTPGMAATATEKALGRASPYMRCSNAAKPTSSADVPAPSTVNGQSWELRPVAGQTPLAFIKVPASPDIESFSLFCNQGHPALAMLMRKSPALPQLTVTWVASGHSVDVAMGPGNKEATFWLADLGGSQLPRVLAGKARSAEVRVSGRSEGEVSLSGSTAAVQQALGSCYRF